MAQEKNKIGQYLKRFREAFNLQQNKVAESIGILPQLYLKYEKDKSVPSASVIINLANAYNVSADYLLGRTDTPNSNIEPLAADEETIKEIRRAALAEVDKQIALKFPRYGMQLSKAM